MLEENEAAILDGHRRRNGQQGVQYVRKDSRWEQDVLLLSLWAKFPWPASFCRSRLLFSGSTQLWISRWLLFNETQVNGSYDTPSSSPRISAVTLANSMFSARLQLNVFPWGELPPSSSSNSTVFMAEKPRCCIPLHASVCKDRCLLQTDRTGRLNNSGCGIDGEQAIPAAWGRSLPLGGERWS